MIQILSCFLILGFAGLAPSGALAQEKLLALTGDYRPLTGEKLKDGGPLAVVVARAYKMIALNAELQFKSWTEIPAALEQGDTVAFPYLKSPERLSKFLYSDVVYSDVGRFFARKGVPSSLFKNKKFWKSKTVCRPDGWAADGAREKFRDFTFKIRGASDLDACFVLLEKGGVDLVMSLEAVAVPVLRARYGEKHGFQVIEDVREASDFFVIVSRENPKARALLSSFNRGLDQLKSSGEYKRLLDELKLSSRSASTQGEP